MKIFINKKIFINLFKNTVKIQQRYSSDTKKQKWIALSQHFISQSHTYKPQIRIQIMQRLIHNDQNTPQKIVTQELFSQIMNQLAKQVHSLPHKSINNLLDLISVKNLKYNSSVNIMVRLNKIFLYMKQGYLNKNQISVTIKYLTNLQFPKVTINKWVSMVLDNNGSILSQSHPLNVLKFNIILLQEPYIGINLTKIALQALTKHKWLGIDQLSLLWHICVIIEGSLKKKVEYEEIKRNIHETLFNPYSSLQTQQNNVVSKTEVNNSSEAKRQKLKYYEQIMQNFNKQIVKQKLKQNILKTVFSLEQQIKTKHFLMLTSIIQLSQLIIEHIHKNIQKLRPIEFMSLIKIVPLDYYQTIKTQYWQKMSQFMSLQEKIFLILQSHQHTKLPINKEILDNIINQLQTINYKQIVGIVKILEQFPKQDEDYVGKIIKKLTQLSQKKQKQ